MRIVALCLAALALAGCETAAQREYDRLNATARDGGTAEEACLARVRTLPAYGALRPKIPVDGAPSLAMQTDRSKATPDEVHDLYVLHAALAPCRKIKLETADRLNPALVPPIAEAYASVDAAFVGVIEQRQTWGEFARAYDAARTEMGRKAMAVGMAIKRGLDQSHSAELARRQAAAAALQNWAYQQQVLLQNQQLITAINQPRVTNCQYVGAYLQCTTF